MRGKVKTGRVGWAGGVWMTHLLVKVRADREKGQRGIGWNKRQWCRTNPRRLE